MPKVSIIMNCYNGEQYLAMAIQSVLNQSYTNWELIFWDNQSSDHSADIFKSFSDPRLRYFQSKVHTSLGEARVQAWKKVRGDYVAILDVDDEWMPNKLAMQLPRFDDPQVGIVISDTLWVKGSKRKNLYSASYPPEGDVFVALLDWYFVSLQTLMVRKSTVDQLKLASFDSRYSMIADFDLVMRLSRICKLAVVKEVLAIWRIHGKNLTFVNSEENYKEKKEWIRQYEGCKHFFQGCEAVLARFKMNVEKSEMIRLILFRQKRAALKLVQDNQHSRWYYIPILLIPISGYIIRLIKHFRYQIA